MKTNPYMSKREKIYIYNILSEIEGLNQQKMGWLAKVFNF